ncbi:MAG: KpsF/GutQ family sugar-phosphate isomerase [Cyanobacteria bacterium SZAS LIN-2]|nr:KpsF/GutQ family sugar-phosphate isomerase [Cyanobacteria bacterium SZAS LIN-2]
MTQSGLNQLNLSPAAEATDTDFQPTASDKTVPAKSDDILTLAAAVLEQEAGAILRVKDRLDQNFCAAMDLLLNCSGKVVVTGMGKSGHIGSKIAATFASTGTPAFFVHPAELRHGDFGMLEERDLVIALSSSGETQEIKLVLEPIKRMGLKLVALTGNTRSTLAQYADAVIDVSVEREACPLNLAPTTSTTVSLAMGDALAIVLMTKKQVRAEDFARSHPGGALGKSLLTVRDIMRTGMDVPVVPLEADHETIVSEITRKKLGFTAVCDKGRLKGIITDGDLRRALTKFKHTVFEKSADEIMTVGPRTISENSLAVEALKVMEKYSISDLLIVDQNEAPVGLIDLKDLLHAGII